MRLRRSSRKDNQQDAYTNPPPLHFQKQVTDLNQRILEIRKCKADPVYFLKNYGVIQEPIRGKIPFLLYPFQEDLLREMFTSKNLVVLKSRQMGISTLLAGFCAWLSIFYSDKKTIIVATKGDTAKTFLDKVKILFAYTPKWMKPEALSWNQMSLDLGNGSVIKVETTTKNAVRSHALTLLVLDEAAFIADAEEVFTSAAPALSTGGKCIALSTPNGPQGWFYNTCLLADDYQRLKEQNPEKADELAQTNFSIMRLPWQLHPDRDENWYEMQCKSYGYNQKTIAQELNCVAGNTRIITDEGFKLASEIKVGDRVLTHLGRFKDVVKTYTRQVEKSEKVLSISVPGARTRPIRITSNHPLLMLNMDKQGILEGETRFARVDRYQAEGRDIASLIEFIPGNALIERGYTNKLVALAPVLTEIVPKTKLTIDTSTLGIDCSEVTEKYCRYYKQKGSIVRQVPIDFHLGRLVGLFLAEGYEKDKRHHSGISFAFHRNELPTLVLFIQNYLKELGVSSSVEYRKYAKNAIVLHVHNKFIRAIVHKFVPEALAADKNLNFKALFEAGEEFILGVLTGYYEGDGLHKIHSNKASVTSASPKLLYQIKMLLTHFGHLGRLGEWKLPHSQVKDTRYIAIEGVEQLDIQNPLAFLSTPKEQFKKKQARVRQFDKWFFAKPTVAVLPTGEVDTVYNFEVEDDHSYVAESLVVHNCDFTASGDKVIPEEIIRWYRKDDRRMSYLPGMDTEVHDEILSEFLDEIIQQYNFSTEEEVVALATELRSAFSESVRIFKQNREFPGKTIAGVDVASGGGSDFSAAVFWNNQRELVASVKGKFDTKLYSMILYLLARYYNNADLAIERNSYGNDVILRLSSDLKYQNLLEGSPGKVGFWTGSAKGQSGSREFYVSRMIGLFNNPVLTERPIINDTRIFEELDVFVWKNGKAQAAGKDSHDDMMMATAIYATADSMNTSSQVNLLSLYEGIAQANYDANNPLTAMTFDSHGGIGLRDLLEYGVPLKETENTEGKSGLTQRGLNKLGLSKKASRQAESEFKEKMDMLTGIYEDEDPRLLQMKQVWDMMGWKHGQDVKK